MIRRIWWVREIPRHSVPAKHCNVKPGKEVPDFERKKRVVRRIPQWYHTVGDRAYDEIGEAGWISKRSR
jgi:hypothetical protein